jgi:hypothetical protein
MVTVQVAWGVAGVRLRGGVVEGGLQGGARSLGVGKRESNDRREKKRETV